MKKKFFAIFGVVAIVGGIVLGSGTFNEANANTRAKKHRVWVSNPGGDIPCVIIMWYAPGCALMPTIPQQ